MKKNQKPTPKPRQPPKPNFHKETQRIHTAIHESGHVIVAWFLPYCPTVLKVSINIKEKIYSGLTIQPKLENGEWKKENLLADIAQCYGGLAAELLHYNSWSRACDHDIKNANNTAREMICELAMGQSIIIRVDPETCSEELTRKVELEIAVILKKQLKLAKKIISEHKEQLLALSAALLKHNTLTEADLIKILGPKTRPS
jgi:cell division protease FtsH